MDKSLGDILQKIKELEIGQNTIIIFMSDNGMLELGRRYAVAIVKNEK